jgi:hypothetical protein
MHKKTLPDTAQKGTMFMHQGWAELNARPARPKLGRWVLLTACMMLAAFWRP